MRDNSDTFFKKMKKEPLKDVPTLFDMYLLFLISCKIVKKIINLFMIQKFIKAFLFQKYFILLKIKKVKLFSFSFIKIVNRIEFNN